MTSEPDRLNKIRLMLQSNGYLVLDKDYSETGCTGHDLDASIVMEPVSILKLAELTRARNLDWFEADTPERLGQLVKDLKDSAEIIEDAIAQIETELSK